MNHQHETQKLINKWKNDTRWKGVVRPYSPEDVIKLRGSVKVEHTLARLGAEKLWELFRTEPFVRALGAMTGGQAVQQVQAGLKAIYVSGWQVAADQNLAMQTYPDQGLYPSDSVPSLVKRINNALQRADEISHIEGNSRQMPNWYAPIVADAEAGFGGILNAFELMKSMIEAGAAAVHFEDQLSAAKKCGHMGGKVLVPMREAIDKLVAARLAADVLDVPTIIIARTDADRANLLTSDIDERDRRFLTGERTQEGYYRIRYGLETAIARAIEFAPYADVVWCETATPNLEEARIFAEAVRKRFPDKPLAYNCSPSFNWNLHLNELEIAEFQNELGKMGYKFQFITLAGFHSLNSIMFELAHSYREEGMTAYARLQNREFELAKDHGYRAIKHQSFVGAGYFDTVNEIITGSETSTRAMHGSTEAEQFKDKVADFSEAELHHDGKAELRHVPEPAKLVKDLDK
ncbi:MAG: isocitrate lyase [Calditrichia bacterium]